MVNNQKRIGGFIHIFLLFFFVLIGVIGVGYFAYKYGPVVSLTQEHDTEPLDSPTPTPPSDWKTYRNEKYGFEFKYPNSYRLGIYDAITGLYKEVNGSEEFIGIYSSESDPYVDFMEIQVVDFKNIDQKTLEGYANENFKENTTHFKTSKISPLQYQKDKEVFSYTFSGEALQTYKWSGLVASDNYKVVMYEHLGRIYCVYLTDKKEFNQILSTFGFTK